MPTGPSVATSTNGPCGLTGSPYVNTTTGIAVPVGVSKLTVTMTGGKGGNAGTSGSCGEVMADSVTATISTAADQQLMFMLATQVVTEA